MLTRKSLQALGIEGDKIDAIIEGHVETVEGLKAEKADIQSKLEALSSVASERDKLRGDLDKANKSIELLKQKQSENDGIVTERDQLKTEVESLKSQISDFTAKETTANNELTTLREQLAAFETDKNTATAEAERLKTEFDAFKTQVETEKTNAVKRDAVRTALRNGGVVRSDFQDLILNSMSMNDITMTEDGIENVESFIESTKSKYPSCFGTVTEGGTPPVEPLVGGGTKKLTIAQIKKMTPDEINANWDAVQAAMKAQR